MKQARVPGMRTILLTVICALFVGATQAIAQAPAPARPEMAPPPPAGQEAFATPEAAFDAFVAAVRRGGDDVVMRKLFGDKFRELIWIDPDDIDAARKKFLEGYDKSHKINTASDGKVVLEAGDDGWTFPIPMVKRADGWRFDVVAGADEIQDREIGANELAVIQVLLAIVDAQFEYIDIDPMKVGTAQYARRLLSSPGKKDGLYWEQKAGEPESPLGDLIAQAQAEGANKDEGYFGYHYRMLYAQGANAQGGARNYLVNDRMIGGFAVVAWPVRYADTGVKTFIVNQDGVVFEKDLGPNSAAVAAQIKSFDPDKTWEKADTTP